MGRIGAFLLFIGALGLSITAADFLHRRGRRADDDTRRFLDPKLSHLTPPDAMAGRSTAPATVSTNARWYP